MKFKTETLIKRYPLSYNNFMWTNKMIQLYNKKKLQDTLNKKFYRRERQYVLICAFYKLKLLVKLSQGNAN